MQGGDFSAIVSASQSVGPVGFYTWNSTQMVSDVQSWLDNPGFNFGWLVLGDESTLGTESHAHTKASSDSAASAHLLNASNRPEHRRFVHT